MAQLEKAGLTAPKSLVFKQKTMITNEQVVKQETPIKKRRKSICSGTKMSLRTGDIFNYFGANPKEIDGLAYETKQEKNGTSSCRYERPDFFLKWGSINEGGLILIYNKQNAHNHAC